MQFQVPQFIEIEDTIFGPFTFRQFLYLAGGVGLCFIWYVYLKPWPLAVLPILGTAGLSAALAFYKYNDRDFIYLLESAVKFFFTKKLYLWKKDGASPNEPIQLTKKVNAGPEGVPLPKLSASKLKDLTWSLDVNPEEPTNNNEQ
ncbi:MAG: hypothetical protein COV08_03655 [Candidatus Vogelbacteria bacterium CG10_big_fil_rev_8_21_14_0_10_49_38]|uniref:PrgI family protein n=1 Tax=Candidatus Vogelbacteria bacterium CG10_big_fil_rev_8_21_14_0_10_49_38 TaxID=1975043 RepID=A0A2H0RGP4_9BACT|nr:MAG: hypothetical protein COV08_03655 [Candidatus Vogelbacteria bacterium CG10_big_fil_rev_8_21_14_0_10_49_38]